MSVELVSEQKKNINNFQADAYKNMYLSEKEVVEKLLAELKDKEQHINAVLSRMREQIRNAYKNGFHDGFYSCMKWGE